MLPTSRSEAKERGERLYVGSLCRNGNHGPRRVSDGNCICKPCAQARAASRAEYIQAWSEKNREAAREIKRRSAARRVEAKRESNRRYRKENAAKILADTRARQAMLLRAMPAWADRAKIAAFYAEAKRLEREQGGKWHVDHVIPLRGKNVCGLHVEHNLRVCPAQENASKGNRFDVDQSH